MSVNVQLKHSATANKAPLPTDLVEGELAININAASPAAYIKDSAGAVVKLAGAGSVSTPDATTTSKGVVQLADPAGIAAGTAGLVVDAAQLKAAQATAAGSTTAPAAPAAGQVWVDGSATPSVINVWNGSAWIPQAGATVTAAVAPTTPAAGQVWVNTSVAPNVSSIWDGTAWVAAAPDGAAAAALANDAKYATKAELAAENLWDRTGTVVSPATAGDVVNISAGTAALPGLAVVGDAGTGLSSPGPGQLAISTSGAQRLVVDASGNIGIGANPSSYAGYTTLTLDNVITGGAVELKKSGVLKGQFYYDGTQARLRANLATDLTLDTNDTERLRITSAGLVGVGVSAPSGTLEVGAVAGAVTAGDLIVSTGSTAASVTVGRISSTGGDSTTFRVRNRVNSTVFVVDGPTERVGIGVSAPGGLFHVGPSGGGVIVDNTYSELAPPSSGNDSYIFRSNNDASLNFSSRPGAGGRAYRFWRGSNVSMIIDDAGRVGIGTTSASNLLHLAAAGASYLQIQNTTAGNSIYLGNSSGNGVIQVDGANSLNISTNGSERCRVDSSGRLLVGTSSASTNALLQVEGTARLKSFADKAALDAAMPAPVAGCLAVVASKLYFRDATAWKEVSLGAALA